MIKRWVSLFLCLVLLCGSALDYTDEEAAGFRDPELLPELMEDAMSVYAWFVIWPLGGDLEEPSEEGDTYRVLDERYDTYEELSALAGEYFSPELVEELFGMGLYEEINGYLYVGDDFSIINQDLGGEAYQLISQNEDEMTILATVDYLPGTSDAYTDEYRFVLSRREEGWVFTAFPFYW